MDDKDIIQFLAEIPKNSKVCIYGAGRLGKELAIQINLHRKDVTIVCYADSYKDGFLDSLKIINGSDFKKHSSLFNLVLVASNGWEDIVSLLEKNNILNYKVMRKKPTFTGWGMSTIHTVPWEEERRNAFFLKAHQDCRKNFDFSGHVIPDNFDSLLWRHWIIAFAIRYVVEFSKEKNKTLVECGVGNGISAFFALRELKGLADLGKISTYSMHLYDSWMPMQEEYLLPSEKLLAGEYKNLDINRVKKNLNEFSSNITFHQGFIPDSLNLLPAPKSISYVHIDLNSAAPTLAALEFFYPRLLKGGVIVFDDYGWQGYEDTQKVINNFLSQKPGVLMPLPTSQAIYYR